MDLSILFRLALAAAAAIPPSWLAFSLIFGESNGGLRLARWRPALFALTAAVPLGWIALATGRVVQPVRVGATGDLLVGLDVWGKVYFSVYLVGLVVVLLHMENLYRDASRLARHKIKFLVVGVFLAFCLADRGSKLCPSLRLHPSICIHSSRPWAFSWARA